MRRRSASADFFGKTGPGGLEMAPPAVQLLSIGGLLHNDPEARP
jgi:hypothetical protein